MRFLDRLFKPRGVADVLHDQLFEAERLQVEHLAAAEMHMALAGVYGARIQRIRKAAPPHVPVRAVK
jgi:hypothetical protein